MKTIYLNQEQVETKPCVATIGFFDGVHRGHQYLIKHVEEEAREDGLESMVVTFDRHPRQVLHSDFQPAMLCTLDEKLLLLSKTDIDQCAVVPFNEETAALPARDFMEKILRNRLNVKKLVIGYDNRFGHNRTEGFDDYVGFGRELGIEVIQSRAFVLNGVNVSSSVIRSYLLNGEIELAEQCLGYPYSFWGRVTEGHQEGRKMGFPTANLDLSECPKLIPAKGVYAVKARIEGTVEMKHAMMNIGTRPTFDGDQLTFEVHILNFSDDIYGKQVSVSFIHRLRAEHHYDSPEQLQKQLQEDEKMVLEQFEKDIEE